MLLNLKNVTVHYDTAEAVKDISIEITEGSIVSIIGANGAGKSTILRAISGLVGLTSGDIYFMSKNISGMPANEIVRLGISHIPEGRRPFPYMSVTANLKLGAYLRTDKAGIVTDLQKIFEVFPPLKERRNLKAGSLSGGEQQMLAIGRALMARPKLILMDEPSMGLGPLIIEQLADVIKAINKGGTSILLVEQNAGLVAKVSDRGYVLEVGKIVLEGDFSLLMDDDFVRRAFLG
jgi:branched-chain amino acid transport system ATP-binding protein